MRCYSLHIHAMCACICMLWGGEADGRSLYQQSTIRKRICVEPPCVLASASVLRSLNISADPCESFFQFSCGGWLADHDIPVGQSDYSSFQEVRDENVRIVRKLLEKENDVFNGKESEAVRKAKNYYNACMNTTFVDEHGAQPLKEIIAVFGGWSLLDNDDEVVIGGVPSDFLERSNLQAVTSGRLLDTLVVSHKLGMTPLFNMGVTVDDKNSSERIIQFIQDGLQLLSPELYDSNTSLTEAYVRLGVAIAQQLQFGDSPYDPEEEEEKEFYENAVDKMRRILDFEHELALAFVPSDDLSDPEATYHKMTVKQFSTLIPSLEISTYLNQMFNDSIPEGEAIVVSTPDYFKRLSDLLQHTPDSVIKDYIVWHTMYPMLSYLSKPIQEALHDFDKEFTGSGNGVIPIWQRCVEETRYALGGVTGALFVKEHALSGTKEQVEDILQTIRQAFIDSLPSLDWMQESTKSTALKKALAMDDKIGWPAWLLDPEKLDDSYKEVMVDPYDQFLNMIWMRKHSEEANLNLRGKPVDRSKWHMTADTVNAYYNPSANEMVFPAGILQLPFYSHTTSMALNYGGIGVVIGHELTHGFDNTGRKYDKHGNLNDWWDTKSAEQYEKRTECMVKQYSNYTVEDDVHVDGLLTLGENIADNGGIQAAFSAFKSWLKTKPGQMEQRLPGLQDFSAEQLFFIGSAQVWCSKSSPERTLIQVLTNPHSPAHLRVMGMLSNFPAFADAFQCALGSPMNPEKKCRVW